MGRNLAANSNNIGTNLNWYKTLRKKNPINPRNAK